MKQYFSTERKIKLIWWGLIATVGLIILMFALVRLEVFGKLPDVEELENPEDNIATEVISADGKVIGKFYSENRTPAKFKDLSPYLVQALIATEDERFYQHSGIDFRSVFRAVLKFGSAGGGSTITQQLAKMLFTVEPAPSLINRITQKLKEWVIAVQLERRYTKEEIIAMYFNRFDFIHQAVGINSAAKIYFNKKPAELTIEEAASLVGMAKNPVMFNVKSKQEANHQRRNVVFQQMLRNRIITKADFDSLSQILTVLNFSEESHNEGLAPYLREQLRMFMDNWRKESGYDHYTDGLKVYLTIDSRMQQYAEEAVVKHLSSHQKKFFEHWKGRAPWGNDETIIIESMKKSNRYIQMKLAKASEAEIKKAFATPVQMKVFDWDSPNREKDTLLSPLDSVKYYQYILQTGFMATDPATGEIKAWVGGINHKYFKYDHVNVRARRQIGSTFKPFVYTLAVDNGFSPCFKAPNDPVTFEDYDNWTPKNADGKNGGEMELKRALALSVNNISAYLMKQLGPKGPENVIELARAMGIEGELEPYPSICLGTPSLSVFEMVGAYATYANKGVHIKPYYISRIEDKNGKIIYSSTPKANKAMKEETAYVMIKMMERATYGTAAKLRYQYGLTNPIACKTGTTNDQADGWFMGVTPQLAAGAWVGNEHRAVRFRTLQLGSGSEMAMPIWAYFFQKVLADQSINLNKGEFEKPNQELSIEVDCERYVQPNRGNQTGQPLMGR